MGQFWPDAVDRLAVRIKLLLIFSFIIKSVTVAGLFSLPVVQQDNPDYLANGPEITQFALAAHHGNIGLLAHNTLSGAYFSQIQIGQVVSVKYEDGHTFDYVVTKIDYYQATEPASIHSDFIDLETGHRLTALQTYNKYYRGRHHLTLQTCLSDGENDAWGRMFIVAYPK